MPHALCSLFFLPVPIISYYNNFCIKRRKLSVDFEIVSFHFGLDILSLLLRNCVGVASIPNS